MKMRWLILITVLFLGCTENRTVNDPAELGNILEKFYQESNPPVLVAAHRALHNDYPENSLAAIQAAIDNGVDIAEIDVRRTRDGHLVLMHDGSVDRTTDGEGKVAEMTLAQIRELALESNDEDTLVHRVPLLEEALLLAKDRIMLDMDMKSVPVNQLVSMVHQTGTGGQVLFFKRDFTVLDSVLALDSTLLVMPRARAAEEVPGILEKYHPKILHIDDSFFTEEVVNQISSAGCRIWINGLGVPDVKALTGFAESAYGPLIAGGANVIQTDQPVILITYLKESVK